MSVGEYINGPFPTSPEAVRGLFIRFDDIASFVVDRHYYKRPGEHFDGNGTWTVFVHVVRNEDVVYLFTGDNVVCPRLSADEVDAYAEHVAAQLSATGLPVELRPKPITRTCQACLMTLADSNDRISDPNARESECSGCHWDRVHPKPARKTKRDVFAEHLKKIS